MSKASKLMVVPVAEAFFVPVHSIVTVCLPDGSSPGVPYALQVAGTGAVQIGGAGYLAVDRHSGDAVRRVLLDQERQVGAIEGDTGRAGFVDIAQAAAGSGGVG